MAIGSVEQPLGGFEGGSTNGEPVGSPPHEADLPIAQGVGPGGALDYEPSRDFRERADTLLWPPPL